VGGAHECDGHSFGVLLRKFRAACRLTQEELAERSGLSVDAIGMLERGTRRAPRSSTIECLAGALKLDPQQKDAFFAAAHRQSAVIPCGEGQPADTALALLASLPTDVPPPRAPLPTGSRMPLAPNPLFVGSSEEILEIASAFRGEGVVALGQMVASTGLGGLGKTQLAVEFVHRYGRFFAGGVFWLSFASPDEIPLQVASCAGADFETRPVEERLELVRGGWQSSLPRLLVFDNCEEERLLEAWRPASGGCRVLVTSRRSHWTPTLGVTALPLDLLPRSDSIELLRRYRPDLPRDDPGLDAIAQELGDLPLALHLAGSYLRAYRDELDLDGYLAELRGPEVVQHASLLGAGLEDSPSPTHHVHGVAQTFAHCLGRLDRTSAVDQVAVALLARMSCMAPGEPVPRDLLAKTLEDVDPRRRADGLRRLGAVGMVEEGDGWLRLHRLLVHFVRHERLDRTAQSAVDLALIGCGSDAEHGRLTGAALAAVIPHLVDVASRDARDEARAGDLYGAVGHALRRAGDLRSARPWFQHALETGERVLGPDHPDTATRLGDLASLLFEQGELSAARPRFERALAMRERILGADHPGTAQALNNLATVLMAQGELVAARPLYERALAIRERVLGCDHEDTAASLNNLAVLSKDQGDLAAARSLYERALATWERVLGPDHPYTAQGLSNLALLLRIQGELAAARPILERVLAVRERVLGPDHPDTALGLNNLALVLKDQGELAAARPLYERALETWERVLGPNHPNTATGINNLARLLRDQGELDAARLLCERALAIRERALGPDHPHTAQSLHNLAVLLQDRGEPAAARPLLERALAIRQHVLGPDHRDTVATRRSLEGLTAGR
jgi:tetratricopeptide (TPR) repeat protein/transcriptional regulator with XRE-family HTH domain